MPGMSETSDITVMPSIDIIPKTPGMPEMSGMPGYLEFVESLI